MKLRAGRWFVCIAVMTLGGESVWATDSTLVPFAMEDQFKQKYTDEQFRNSVLVILVANKGGSQFSRKWSPALRDSLAAWQLGGDVKLLGVADMRGVPFFIKGMVKGKLPRDPRDWMLVDWKGVFAKAYECTKDTCNVLIFDSGSALRHRLMVGPVTPSDMSAVRNLLLDVTGRDNLSPDSGAASVNPSP